MDYVYDACGLEGVKLLGLPEATGQGRVNGVRLARLEALHRVLIEAVATRRGGLSPKEFRFLRSELELTQGELAGVVGRDLQTVGRWERGESPIDRAAEIVVRARALEEAGVRVDAPMVRLSALISEAAVNAPILIDASDPSNYRLVQQSMVKPRSAAGVAQFPAPASRNVRRVEPPQLRMAARSSASQPLQNSTSAESQRSAIIGQIVGSLGEATLRQSGSDVLVDLPAGQRCSQLSLGEVNYSLLPGGRSRRYRVLGLSVGAASRFTLNQAKIPAEYPARWT